VWLKTQLRGHGISEEEWDAGLRMIGLLNGVAHPPDIPPVDILKRDLEFLTSHGIRVNPPTHFGATLKSDIESFAYSIIWYVTGEQCYIAITKGAIQSSAILYWVPVFVAIADAHDEQHSCPKCRLMIVI